jgi:hypothetical protein
MHACARDLAHPNLQALIADENVHKLLPGHKVALHIVDAIFDFAFVTRGGGQRRADETAIVQGQPPVGLAQHRVLQQEFAHRGLEVIGHYPRGHTPEALKSAPMERNPGRGFLVKDQFGVLVPTETQGGDEHIGTPCTTRPGVK